MRLPPSSYKINTPEGVLEANIEKSRKLRQSDFVIGTLGNTTFHITEI